MTTPDTTPSPDAARVSLVRLGAWLGLGYGYLEAAAVMLLGALPGGLAWQTGNSVNVVWFAPIFYGVAGLFIGAIFAGLARLRPGWPWDTVLVGAATGGGLYLGGLLPPATIARWSLVVLGAGAGIQFARVYRKRRAGFARVMRRGLPTGVALAAALACAVPLATRWRESARRGGATPRAGSPNVLVIVIDTLRGDHLGFMGYDRPTSPRLDALAAEGTLYTAAYANSSWTLPSHASLFTGRLPQEHGAGKMRHAFLDDTFPTVAERFSKLGYATGGFVANTYWCGRQTGLARGFAHFEDFYGSLGDAVARTALGRILSYDVAPHFGARQIPGRKTGETIAADYLAWLDGIGGAPSFAFLNFFDVHAPYIAAPQFVGRFGRQSSADCDESIQFGHLAGDMPHYSDDQLAAMRDSYDSCLLSVDHDVGVLLDGLAARHVLDDTIVVVTGDHGESFGDHGMVFHGHSLYREQILAPLIVRWPAKVPAGARVAQAVGIDRVPATVTALVGDADAGFPGRPLPGLGLGADAPPEPVVCGVARRSQVPADWPTSRGWVTSLETERWHFIAEEDGSVELFDVTTDPHELTDVSGRPDNAALAAGFRAKAAGLWK